MKKILTIFITAVMLAITGLAQAVPANGASANLDMEVTIALSCGAQMTFYPDHGWNGAYAGVWTTVGGVSEEDEDENGDYPSYPVSAYAFTNNGTANGAVTVITLGFDYQLEADAMVYGLDVGDEGYATGYAYAWPDWLKCESCGTATVTIDYSYTLDTLDSIDDALASIYMNAFFADHPGTNYLTAKEGWTLGYGDNPNTTIVEYEDAILAGDSKTVTSSVSWDICIPSCDEPYSWWSLWTYGEATVDVTPVPEPATIALLGFGALALLRKRRK